MRTRCLTRRAHPSKVPWAKLPDEVLLRVAEELVEPRDLCLFLCCCRRTWRLRLWNLKWVRSALEWLCAPPDADDGAARIPTVKDGAAWLPSVVEAMRQHPRLPELQQLSCQTLSCILSSCKVPPAAVDAAFEAGSAVVAAALRTGDAALSLAACNALSDLCISGRGERSRQAAAEAGAAAGLVSLMRGAPCTTLRSSAAKALRQLVTDVDSCRSAAAAAGAVGVASAALRLHATEPELASDALELLCELCSGDDAGSSERRQAIVDADAVRAAIAVEGAKAAPFLCRLLISLCRGSDAPDDARRQAAADAGAIGAVVARMSAQPANSELLRLGFRALSLIGGGADAQSEARKAALAESGVLRLLLDTIAARTPRTHDLQNAAHQLLATLCEGDALATRRRLLVDAGAVGLVLDAIRANGRSRWLAALKLGCDVLAALCAELPSAKREAARRDAFGTLVQLIGLYTDDPLLAVRVHEVLVELLCGDDDECEARRSMAGAAGAPRAVLLALREWSQHIRLPELGCRALSALWSGDSPRARALRREAFEAGAAKPLLALVARDRRASQVSEACGALAALCGGDDAHAAARRRAFFGAKLIDRVLVAMRQHPCVGGLQARGCALLAAVCCDEFDAPRRAAREAGAVALVTHALRAHLLNAEVQRSGSAALRRIGGEPLG